MIEFLGWFIVIYLLVGVFLTIFVFEDPHWEVDMHLNDERVTTNYHWLSQLLNIIFWPYVVWTNKEEDD